MNELPIETQRMLQLKGNRATTLTDIAQVVGVSKAAVSAVLSTSRSKARVSDATRQRILDAARELNYQPNTVARSLFHRKTNVFGFYSVSSFDPIYPFYGMLLRGILKGCDVHQKSALIHGTFSAVGEESIFQELLNGQIDGLILFARERTALVERLIESRLPVVTIAYQQPDLPCVTVDNEQGGRLLAQHLKQKRYENVFYGVAEADLSTNTISRFEGFSTEAAALGMNVKLFNMGSQGHIDANIMRQVIKSKHERPQVIACFNDATADTLISLCHEEQVRVPDDLAITGFDGFAPLARPALRLTTVRAPWDVAAYKAVEILTQQIDGEPIPLTTHLPVELVVGETT